MTFSRRQRLRRHLATATVFDALCTAGRSVNVVVINASRARARRQQSAAEAAKPAAADAAAAAHSPIATDS